MSYTSLGLVGGDIFKAEHVNHIEDGIRNNESAIAQLDDKATQLQQSISQTGNSIGTGVLTIQKNGTDVGTFSANSSEDKTINIEADKVTSDVITEALGYTPVAINVKTLENYYKKTETYTQEEINNLLSVIPKYSTIVVDELPTENIKTDAVYLVNTQEEDGNMYTEYIYINNAWEMLGTQTLDLTPYALSSSIGSATLTIKKNGISIGTFGANASEDVEINIEADKQVNADWDSTDGVSQILNKPTNLADFNDDATHRVVTDTEKQTWNAKSDFSGNYNDLENIPSYRFVEDEDDPYYLVIETYVDIPSNSEWRIVSYTDDDGNIRTLSKSDYTIPSYENYDYYIVESGVDGGTYYLTLSVNKIESFTFVYGDAASGWSCGYWVDDVSKDSSTMTVLPVSTYSYNTKTIMLNNESHTIVLKFAFSDSMPEMMSVLLPKANFVE